MARPQVNDDFGGGRLQTQARPGFTPVAAPQPRWQGLGEVFAKAELMAQQEKERKDAEDKDRAGQVANSMTVAELGKKVRAGEILATESPVFAATLQNMYGTNAQHALEREVLSQITTGEVKFNNPEEIDLFITERRNELLAGHSKYAAAGFDKAHNTMRQKFMDATKQTVDKETTTRAVGEATDKLANTLLDVTGDDFKGTPEDAANVILREYELLRKAAVLPPGADRTALLEVLTRATNSGRKDLVGALLDSKRDDVGTVRNLIGEAKAGTLLAQAEAKHDAVMRQDVDTQTLPFGLAADEGKLDEVGWLSWATDPERRKYTTTAGILAMLNRNRTAIARQQEELRRAHLLGQHQASIAAAQAAVDAAIAQGQLPAVQGTNVPQVLDKGGNVGNFNVNDYAAESILKQTRGMQFDQALAVWSTNNVDNPDWQNKLNQGLMNISSLAFSAPGKPAGELNAQATEAIKLFRALNDTQPAYAKKLLGNGYEQYANIDALVKNGFQENFAAALVASAERGDTAGPETKIVMDKVNAAVSEWSANPWYKWGWVQRLLGDNTTANSAQLQGRVRQLSTLMARSGMYPTPEAAIEQSVKYLADPKISAKVNGTLYMRTEMPTPPQGGGSQEEWLELFINAEPKKAAEKLGYKASEVRLEWSPAERVYRPFVGGVLLTDDKDMPISYSRDAIEKWYGDKRSEDVIGAAAEGKGKAESRFSARQHGVWKARVERELLDLESQGAKLPYGLQRAGPLLLPHVLRERLPSLRQGRQRRQAPG